MGCGLNKRMQSSRCRAFVLSTSSWHLAYGGGQQNSNMDAPAGLPQAPLPNPAPSHLLLLLSSAEAQT
jgi:hypothetical protein